MIFNVLYAVVVAERCNTVFAALYLLRNCRCTEIKNRIFFFFSFSYIRNYSALAVEQETTLHMFILVTAMNLMTEISYSLTVTRCEPYFQTCV